MGHQLAVQTRFPLPPTLAEEMDARKWQVLCEAIFPAAKTSEAIIMAVNYCTARGLDVFKKPVHIVTMWNSALGKEVETVWPGINEVQITAARTGQWAGMNEPVWGPMLTRTFSGSVKGKNGCEERSVNIDFPEFCAVTVYRIVGGEARPFVEPVFWLEAYSRAGGKNSELPTDMWVKRPRGQLHKVAKAASLRAAFPEEGEYTAEEMEGKEIESGGVVIDQSPPPPRPTAAPKPKASPHDPETGEVKEPSPYDIPVPINAEGTGSDWSLWASRFIERLNGVENLESMQKLLVGCSSQLDCVREKLPKWWKKLESLISSRRHALSPKAKWTVESVVQAFAESTDIQTNSELMRSLPDEVVEDPAVFEAYEAARMRLSGPR